MSDPIITRHLSPYVSEQGPASEVNRDRAQVAAMAEASWKPAGQYWREQAEVARAETARLRLEKQHAIDTADAAIEEIARLKAEVERMEKVIDWENLRRKKAEEDKASARAAALEEAAKQFDHLASGGISSAIRALKEKTRP